MQNINFVKGIDPKTGELIGRRDMALGKHTNLCPAIAGGMSWNSGAYSPKTGLYYKVGQEWCMDLEVVKTTPILEPHGPAQHRRQLHAAQSGGRQGPRPRRRDATRSRERRSGK